jgi:hypothetical protein
MFSYATLSAYSRPRVPMFPVHTAPSTVDAVLVLKPVGFRYVVSDQQTLRVGFREHDTSFPLSKGEA